MTPPLGYRTLLHETLRASAAASPEKLAVLTEDSSCTFAELAAWSSGLAATLRRSGVQRGDRVAVFMDNGVEAAVAVYGILKAGAAFTVVNPLTKADKLAYIGADCGIRALITDGRSPAVVEQALPEIPSLIHLILAAEPNGVEFAVPGGVRVTSWAEAIERPDPEIAPTGIPTDVAALIYTSGSTGRPKGVVHTHRSMVFALGSVREYLRLSDEDVVLNVLPLAFDYGLYQLLMTVASAGTLLLERSFAYPGGVLARMTEHHVSVVPGVPTIYSLLIAAHRRSPLSFPGVRLLTNTAAALPVEHIEALREIFPNAAICPMYGLTECKRVAYLDPELIDERRGSVGKAIPGTEAFLLTPEGDPVERGDPGILHVRGPHLMSGYWNAPDRTAEMLVDGRLPGEKILRTGDWFRQDDDGFLYFVGRSDDIIKSRGEKVSPVEIENALYGIPGVHEAAVIGVPDQTLGEAIKAFVVVDPESDLEPRRLRREMLTRLESFMVPGDFVIVASLPKSPNGKIDKRRLA